MEQIGRNVRGMPGGKASKALKTIKRNARIPFVISRSCVRVTSLAPNNVENQMIFDVVETRQESTKAEK